MLYHKWDPIVWILWRNMLSNVVWSHLKNVKDSWSWKKSLVNYGKRFSNATQPCETPLCIGVGIEQWLSIIAEIDRSKRILEVNVKGGTEPVEV